MTRLRPTTARVLTLVDVTYAGRVWRFSESELDIDSDDGSLHYRDGLLAVTIAEGADDGDMSAPPDLSMELMWPDSPTIGELEAAGHDLCAATAEVSRWCEGDTWEQRRVVLRGMFNNPESGSISDTLATTISGGAFEDVSMIPGPLAVADTRTWNEGYIADDDIGNAYPIIIGQPGNDPQNAAGWITGSQSLTVHPHTILIAGHPVAATQVYINSEGDTTGALVDVTHTTDHLGRTVAVIDYLQGAYLSGFGNDVGLDLQPSRNPYNAIYVGWSSGGGLLGPDGTAIRAAGDVLAWALSEIRLPKPADAVWATVDLGRTAGAAGYLRDFLIDGVIEEQTSAWEFISGNLMPLLPASIVTGPDGAYPVVWRYDATATDAVASLDADVDPEVRRVSKIRRDTSQIKNDLSLEYGWSIRTGAYEHVARLGVYVEEYASVIMENGSGDRILITALLPGVAGAGILVSMAAGGVLVATDVSETEVDIDVISGASTTLQIITALNVSALIHAELLDGPGTGVWFPGTGGYQTDFTTALRLSAGAAGSPLCTISQARYGVRTDALQSRFVYDRGTAERILQMRALAYALPVRTVDYQVPEGKYLHLERGHVVTLTDSEVSLSSAVSLVREVQVDGTGTMGIRLQLLGVR